ncbi:TPA: glycosyltransferase [Aeromonas salmonicida]|nr:glycosyltransferase [Aeromonas salmonicida]
MTTANLNKISINHFYLPKNFSNGVSNYINSVNDIIEDKYLIYSKPYEMDKEKFRYELFKFIKSEKNNGQELIIEAAESQASTLLIERNENVHIRMHCPYHLYKRVIRENPDETRFSEEIRAIHKAKAVSSPSHGMLDLLENDLDSKSIHVYKNPIKIRSEYFKHKTEKDIDLIIFSRFNKLKGNEYVEQVINRLSPEINVFIVGKQEQKIPLSRTYNNVTIMDHIEGDDKFEILSRAKVAISLSKFENCSMAILEALSVATPVAAWDVGGNGEIAEPGVIELSPLGDVEFLVSKINELMIKDIPFSDFINSCNMVNDDFKKGIENIENYILNKTCDVYKGIDYRQLHRVIPYIPCEVSNEITNFNNLPASIAFFTGTIASAKEFHRLISNTSLSDKIFYFGKYGSQVKNIIAYDLSGDINIDKLAKVVSDMRVDAIVVDDTFPVHINDIYKLSQKAGKDIIYSSKSPLSDGGYIFDSMGFHKESDYYQRRISRNICRPLSSINKKLAVWAPNIQHNSLYINNIKSFILSQSEQNFDVLCQNQTECNYILELSKKLNSNVTFSLRVIQNTNLDLYSDIIIASDMACDQLLGCSALLHACDNSLFRNKLIIDVESNYKYIDLDMSIEFLRRKVVSNNNQLGLDVIYKVVNKND